MKFPNRSDRPARHEKPRKKFGGKPGAHGGKSTPYGGKERLHGDKPRPHGGKADARGSGKPASRGFGKPAHAAGKQGTRSFVPGRRPERPEAPAIRLVENGVLIWGVHAVRAAWLNPKRRITRLWITENAQQDFDAVITEARDVLLLKRPDPKKVERQELDRITPPASVHQGIVVETLPLHEPGLHDIIGGDTPPDLLLMLDQVTDPHNVGAILRSAAAFGAGAVVMTERNAPTTTGVLAKSASGALEHVPQIHVVNLARAMDELKEAGYWCVGLAEEGEKDLGELDLSGRTVIILGNEGEGLRQLTRKKCDALSRLPTGGAIGSLNVSNAAAVALYETRRQKKKFK